MSSPTLGELAFGWPSLAILTYPNRAYSRDAKYYPDPDTFKPERFLLESGQLNPDVLDPAEIAFGYGRRSVYYPSVRSTDIQLVVGSVPDDSSLRHPSSP